MSLIAIDTTKFKLPEGQYVKEETKKDLLVLHFTAGGSAASAFNTWKNDKDRVATAFILDVDGTIYQTFDPKYYAFHLGFKGSWKNDQRSIAIEIANFGPLKKDGEKLYSWPNNYKNFYCNASEAYKYTNRSFRGFDYFAAFTESQIKKIGGLVEHITTTYNIPKVLPPVEYREKYDPTYFSNWTGIASHQNYRPDKLDIGPAFNFDWIV